MTQKDLVSAVTNKVNSAYEAEGKKKITNAITSDVISAFVDTTVEVVASGDKIQIAGLGTFEGSKRAAREGRNPQTGAKIQIAESVVPKFKAAKAFKDAMKN